MTSPDAFPFAITLFGPMQALVQGAPLPPMRSRKGLWLLALLTLKHNRPVERQWLAAALWPDADPMHGSDNLRPLLSELRGGMGEERSRLQSPDRQTLRLDLTGADVDLITFDAAIQRGTLSDLAQAVALYRGPLLEGCTEEWAQEERRVREAQCLDALMTLGKAALNGGDNAEAIVCYQRAAGLDAWSDEARRGWMQALAQGGDRNAALRVYQEFAQALKNDGGGEPDEQTMALYKRLRAEARRQNHDGKGAASAAAPPAATVGSLPHFVSDLIGREDELLDIAAALRRAHLVTLTGAGGVGKTRLATEAARDAAGDYPDGAWMIALDSLTEGERISGQIAQALGLKEETGRSLLQSVIEYLRARQLLLVLDNCEHLLKASAEIAEQLLQECPGLRILATSREPLGVPGETVWATPSLAAPDPEYLPQQPTALLRVVQNYDSVQLFVERAQSARSDFALTTSNALAAARICSRLEGIPLAIELAAARIKVMTAEQIDARLGDKLALLTAGGRTALSRQQTLRGAIDWSYALLTEEERTLLLRLAIFTGGWTAESAAAVCAGDGVEAERLPQMLRGLAEKSLLVLESDASGERYRFLEMVRQYAAELLLETDERKALQARHHAEYLALAETAELQLRGPEQGQWRQTLRREYENLSDAMTWGIKNASDSETHLRLPAALWFFWYVQGQYLEGFAILQQALAIHSSQQDTLARARALNGAGSLLFFSDYVASRPLYEESLRIRRALGDLPGVASCLVNLGNVASYDGDSEKAIRLMEESQSIYRALGNRVYESSTFLSIGTVYHNHGQPERALEAYEKSAVISKEVGNTNAYLTTLINMGVLAQAQGNMLRSEEVFKECLAGSREAQFERGVAFSLNGLGIVARARNDYDLAEAYLEESLELRRKMGAQREIATSLTITAHVFYATGRIERALDRYEEGLQICVAIGNQEEGVHTVAGIGYCLMALGRYDPAVRLLNWGGAITKGATNSLISLEEQQHYAAQEAPARAALSEEAHAAAVAEGIAMTWEQAVALALKESEEIKNR